MGTFRTLPPDDIRAVLAGFGVGGYRSHAAIAAGTINTNVAVETGEGRYFLRVNEGKTQQDVEREAAIVFHLAARGVPTPAPLRARNGEPFLVWSGAYVSLFPWVPGRVLGRHEIKAEPARQAGQALATLHRAGGGYPDQRAGRYEPEEIRRRFDRIAGMAGGDPALRDAVAMMGPELAALERERRPTLPHGVIHGDLFIDNVLYEGDRLTALLDFEQASWGRLAYDLAVTLLAFAFGRDDFDRDSTRALLEGYAAGRAPGDDERAAFGAELRFACCRFAVTRITDVYMRWGSGAPAGKDFRRYLQRLERVRGHLAAGNGLLAI